MKINWFPGHMSKALRMMESNIKLVDVVGYVLDARAPKSCFNPSFTKIFLGKPCLFILNKCDLADASKVAEWREYFKKRGETSVSVTSINSSDSKKIVDAFATLSAPLVDKYKAKGVCKTVRAMIVGVPNCGKSTIINCLSGKKATITGDKPGVTKGKQWVRLTDGLDLLDTPGTVWSNFTDQLVAQHLAFIGSIKDDIIDIIEVSQLLLEELITLYPKELIARYNIDIEVNNGAELLTQISKNRGFLLRGGEFDYERGAKAVIDDFRKGKIGRITFETPNRNV
ncbi:MAG: ribosome biogenesis GTPase YlqF [Clostridia bacterium]